MKIKNFLLLSLAAVAFAACDNISESERYGKDPVDVQKAKNVLIEDFTGQKCINCPKATDVIHELQGLYGEDHVIAVAIHGGALSLPETNPKGLATEQGKAYHEHWNVTTWPKGKIDRGENLEFTSWSAEVVKRLQMKPIVDLDLSGTTYDAASRKLNVAVKMTGNEAVEGKLQIWLIEDNIVLPQQMPDGSLNKNYVHNHVFRASVNEPYGTPVTVAKAASETKQFDYTLAEKYKPENVSVVAFVYNDAGGVLQVIKKKIQ
ncbi:Omp28 family outer membrane lipoprotein [Alloprevotella tannerae]|jgi:putativeouter membrane protein omp28|uniref:Omp28 family outer membrane lipoprotein n=1 Tax=Alloprevotella tannerae TaxID=76122 RepID=UPI001EDB5BEE|nr:Omp28 family outer membrane lipoprotein [Alloprevotella tannerae]MCG2652028.1 Omp28 family outer membrane lipoprotein [Alloprevotella tannerae]